jgi:hypothetical protein
MKLQAVVLGFSLVTGLGCTPLKMGVPADLAKEADLIQVTDRSRMTGALANEAFKMGPYEVTAVDRKWNSSSSGSISVFSSGETKTGYSFTFKGPQGESKAQCGSQAQNKNTSVMGFDISTSQENIGCVCEGPGASAKLQLAAENGEKLGGPVTAHANNLTVAAVMQFDNGMKSSVPIGYEFRSTSGVGAVDIAHPGKVWMARALDDQTKADLACLTAGLLLYLPPKQD